MKIFNILLCIFITSSVSFAKDEKNKSELEQLELFNKVLYMVKRNYYKDVDSGKLIRGAIQGMLQSLDPHSTYLDGEMFKKLKSDTEGEFGGVGIEVTFKEGLLQIISAIDDTPAYKKGIKAGDKIVEINNKSSIGLNLQGAVELMKGKVGEILHLGIKRESVDKILHFKLKREIIKIKPVKFDRIGDYARIRLSQFQVDSTKHIEEALKSLQKKSKIKGLILDLRNNPGGLLSEAVGISSLFLEKGVVVSTESRDPKIKDIRYVRRSGDKYLKLPLVVLMNGGSASASEIVAGAMQDYKRAKIIGTKSFGKGTVQSLTTIDDDKAIKLTISQYLTPLKRKIHQIGILPDIEVKVDGNKKYSLEQDPQIKAALKQLKRL